ncbi:sperm flagellar protein 1 [Trypanosoma theileri]|uniref:Sperm flagellar protein 1 n=1 Tax=Trypanosoma theileri TaxID=67003 RepID=A0A1X0P9A7_9TRYP|nr:sperm flagellar protein 1 [Trypanosoma theileri]ORC93527.1 sperm flagellar protein 1 [Trypanosoma theileri]
MSVPLTEEDLHELYLWVDDIPISRPKRNIARDFSDGCCVAEVVKFFFPKLVDLHNYTPAMSMRQKKDNWDTLNNRVFRKLHFEVPQEEINDITAGVPGAIERFLRALRTKIAQIKARREEMRTMYDVATPHSAGRHSEGLSGREGGRSMSSSNNNNNNNNINNNKKNNYDNWTATGVQQMQGSSHRQGGAALNSPSMYRTPPNVKNANNEMNRPSAIPSDSNNHDNNTASFRLLLDEKDRTIFELRETVSLLSEKVSKLEELVRVKDEKLNAYRAKLGRM